MMAHPLDNVDSLRGPTASQAAGLTLAAARAVVTAVQATAREGHTPSCSSVTIRASRTLPSID